MLDFHIPIVRKYNEGNEFFVEGYAITTDVDYEDDLFDKKSLKSIAEQLLRNSTVFYNHDYKTEVGAVKEARADEKGVWVKILISKTAPDIIQKIKEGVLTGLSIGGKIKASIKEYSDKLSKLITRILEFNAYEVSIVGLPANSFARSLDWYVKSLFKEEGGSSQMTIEKDEIKKNQEGEEEKKEEQAEGEEKKEEETSSEEETKEAKKEDGKDEVKKSADEEDEKKEDEAKEEAKETESEEEVTEKKLPEEDNILFVPIAEKDFDAFHSYMDSLKTSSLIQLQEDPYPKPEAIAPKRLSEIFFLLDKLIAAAKDDNLKSGIQQIKALLSRALGGTYPYPAVYPYPMVEEAEEKSAHEAKEQKSVSNETEETSKEENKDDVETLKMLEDIKDMPEKFKNMEGTLNKVLGDIANRIKAIENVAGISQGIKGQEGESETEGRKSLWSGVIFGE